MTDITPDLSLSLQAKGAGPVVRKAYDLQTLNAFLQDAYSINARITDLHRQLRAIRPAYLSTAPPLRRPLFSTSNESHDRAAATVRPLTDQERDATDTQAKQLLRQLNSAISALKQAEDVRNQTADSIALSKRARGGLGAIGRWAAGGAVTAKSPEEETEEAARKTVATHRESIIFYLQRKLEQAGRVQTEMMDVRLSREVEKSKSILAQSRVSGGVPHALDGDADGMAATMTRPSKGTWSQSSGLPPADDHLEWDGQSKLSPEQIQAFAQENHELLRHYEDQLDQVRTAEKSILEISELHSTLHSNLQQQSEHIDQLVQDSELTTENLGKGNKELKRASERRSTAQAVFYSTVAFCSFLVIWDLVF